SAGVGIHPYVLSIRDAAEFHETRRSSGRKGDCGMSASGWSYVTAYQGDAAESLRELRERVFRDKEYHWADEIEEDEPRPATIEGSGASEEMGQSGTHSILEVSRVVETTAPPSWDNRREDLGTIRPMAAERVIRYFGTGRPSRARFEELAD